jgi:hypothetical protein
MVELYLHSAIRLHGMVINKPRDNFRAAIAMVYRLDGRGSIPGRSKKFFFSP